MEVQELHWAPLEGAAGATLRLAPALCCCAPRRQGQPLVPSGQHQSACQPQGQQQHQQRGPHPAAWCCQRGLLLLPPLVRPSQQSCPLQSQTGAQPACHSLPHPYQPCCRELCRAWDCPSFCACHAQRGCPVERLSPCCSCAGQTGQPLPSESLCPPHPWQTASCWTPSQPCCCLWRPCPARCGLLGSFHASCCPCRPPLQAGASCSCPRGPLWRLLCSDPQAALEAEAAPAGTSGPHREEP